MEMEEAEEEVFFINTLQVEDLTHRENWRLKSRGRTEKSIDECFWRRAKRAGIAVNLPEDRLMNESERDHLS
jgi:hypothetical protein